MANITPSKGQVLVKWIEENNQVESVAQNADGSVAVPTAPTISDKENRLCQLEVLSGPKVGQIALASEWSLSNLVPGTSDIYFINEESIVGYSDAPISGVLADYED